MINEKKIERILWILIAISFLVRATIAGLIDLGNDEVYYWTYARFPALSHFDHPPMVGWMIQLFTLNLCFDHEFFLRLPALVLGTINTWLIFLLGRNIKNALTGLYAAFLFTASFYCFIISGTFIMPDTPQVFFWLMSLLFLQKALPDQSLSVSSRKQLLAAGVTLGLALLSKYHSAFLIGGAFLYILFFNRKWFQAKEPYIAFLIAVAFFLPVVIWNANNGFISFTFHESRLGHYQSWIRWDFFGTELIGQFFYNNPVNFIIILAAFIALILGKRFVDRSNLWLLLFISLPLSLVFLFFSLFNSTLPHWTGPAYLGFMLIAASYLADLKEKLKFKKLIPWPVTISLVLTSFLVSAGITQIRFGWFPFKKWNKEDMTTQLYGWRQLGKVFEQVSLKDLERNIMPAHAPILTLRWFPAANLDYYAGTPSGHPVYCIGTLDRIHKYYWIDKERGPLKKGTDAYFVTTSDDFQNPLDFLGNLFDSIQRPDILSLFRCGIPVKDVYIYRFYGLKRELRFDYLKNYYEPDLQRIRYWEVQMLTNPEWLALMKEKARKQGRHVDEVIWEEAKWIAQQEMWK